MNSLVVHQHNQKIKMYSHNLMFKKILYSNISTTSTSNVTHPPACERPHSHLLPEKERKKKSVPYKKHLMTRITIVSSIFQLGRHKLVQIFRF